MTETEVSLIAGLQRQDRSAQQQMLDSYGRDVFAQIARLIPAVEDAEEVYQDVFVKVFRNIGKYDAKKSSLRTWVSRIAYNEAISFLRKSPAAVISYEDTMFYYEEMSLKEIAYVTESIPTTIASKLSRTRRKLCKIIKMIQS